MQTSNITPPIKTRRSPRHLESFADSVLHSQPTENIFQQSSDKSPHAPESLPPTMPGTASNPMTPPRPRSMYEGAYNGQLSGNTSATDRKDKRRKSSQKDHSPRPNKSSPTPRPSGNPRSKSQKNIQTPGRTSATPPQAYAGPTFHASPAPSSLPIPKFFQKSLSKSVPETTHAKGLSAMVDSEISEEALSPESSEASPVHEKFERLQQKTREDSPLDIFFHADREEKIRTRLANITNNGGGSAPNAETACEASEVRKPPSPIPVISRHHSRQHTGGSAGGLFPIEMEHDKFQNQSTQSTTLPAPHPYPGDLSRANSAPSDIMTEAGREERERRNARSAELMKLLGTTKPKQSQTLSPEPEHAPATTPLKPYARPTREPTGPFAATPKPDPPIQILSRKQPASLPQLQKQFGFPTSSSQSPRTRPPSNLRQEVPVPPSPAHDDITELPATPTPFRTADLTPTSPRDRNTSRDHTVFSLPSTTVPGVGSTQMQDPKFSSMENDLRRILRLDIIGSEGANGV